MDSQLLYRFIEEYNNLLMFDLCNGFDALSLEDRGLSHSYSTSIVHNTNIKNNILSYGYCERFLHCCKSTPFSQSIFELLRSPFLEFPRYFLESFRFKCENLRIFFSFKFRPGQEHFLYDELQLPKSFDSLSFLSNSLGLSLTKRAYPSELLFTWSSSGAGLRGLVNENLMTKLIVEVITYSNGFYGHSIVLVCIGIGCTVWFMSEPGSCDLPPVGGEFTPFDLYEPFLHMEHNAPGFQKLNFVESTDVSALVESSMRDNNNPFAGIAIPASGPVLKAVGLGLMVAIFLAVDIVPDLSGVINEQ